MSGHGLRRSVDFDGAYSPLGSGFEMRGSVSDDIADVGWTIGQVGCRANSHKALKWETAFQKVEVTLSLGMWEILFSGNSERAGLDSEREDLEEEGYALSAT